MDGAEPGFEEFVRARWTSLVRYGYVLTDSPHDAADLAQEAVARLGSAWLPVQPVAGVRLGLLPPEHERTGSPGTGLLRGRLQLVGPASTARSLGTGNTGGAHPSGCAPPRASAIALAPSGEILIATATPVGTQQSGSVAQEPAAVELGLRLCRDVFCVRPATISFGVVQSSFRSTEVPWRENLLAVGTDRGGRPVIAFRSPSTDAVSVGWCTTTACDSAHLASPSDPRQPGMPNNEELALLHFDDMFDCLKGTCGGDEPAATIDRPQGGVYGVGIEHNLPQRVGVQVGPSAPQPRRAVLLSCADYLCRNPRRTPLVEIPPGFSTGPGRNPIDIWLMAANPDGRVVLAQRSTERIITVRP